MTIFQMQFKTGDVVRAANVTNDDIQNWIKRKVIIGHRSGEVEGGGSPGKHRQFSFYNVIEVATAAALIRAGLPVTEAFMLSQKFSHSGDLGRATWDDGLQDDDPVRHPAVPYHHSLGDTYLVASGDRSEILLDGLDAEKSLSLHQVKFALGRPESWITVNLSAVFARVIHGLALGDARLILDEVYAEAVKG